MQQSLFNNRQIVLEGKSPPVALLSYEADFLLAEADQLFAELRAGLQWRQDRIRVYGKEHLIPRLNAWYADPGLRYCYSGLTLRPLAWTAPLSHIRARIREHCGIDFNSVLANYYRDGQDSVGWHSDDEPELGPQPVVASVSFGAVRRFDLRSKQRDERGQRCHYSLELGHGSLLMMHAGVQEHWQHCVARSRKVLKPRINLSFRQCFERAG